jgi:hypothetical protein
MRRNCFRQVVIVFVVGCVLLAPIGCEEQVKVAREPTMTSKASNKAVIGTDTNKGPSETSPADIKTTSVSDKPDQTKSQTAGQSQAPGPEIKFEKLVHDFGQVAPGTNSTYKFKFTNTGKSSLRIGKIRCSCGCTVAKLPKAVYAPGESGAVEVSYKVGSVSGSSRKTCTVPSNDTKKPKVILTVKARVAKKVDHSPERLNLLLNKENAGCPEITLTSRDTQSFAIKRFKSTGDSITAEYDSSMKATRFVLKPKVDIEKLRKGPRGQVVIDLTHPGCKKITIAFDTLTEFKLNPRIVYVREAEPQKPVTKKVWVFSNYNEDFEIESASSKKGIVKVLAQKKVRNGYEFELQITPPDIEVKRKVFTDVFSVKIKGGKQLGITCYGIYAKTPKE